MEATAIDHVNLRVAESDIEAFVGFYRDEMGFSLEYYGEYRAGERDFFYVRLGPSCIIHVAPRETVPEPTGETVDHFAVFVDASMDEVMERVEAADVAVRTEAVREGATGEYPCVYVEDPAGYTVEFKTSE
ncbi:VOC family protein [Halosimplex salinum]|uniref:VOC family protein n=1 Tax=Halosimplex salinum TaxID=1710538 RepID=UPI000F4A636F|nr:VOC family protein [Halosimplex salinum]